MTEPARPLRPGGSPVAVNPRTGEILAPDDINARILVITDKLETETGRLTEKIHELARVTALYDETYDDALSASTAKNKEQREADARMACRTATTPMGFALAKRKTDLEHEIRAMREEQHNLRAVLSGYQSCGSNIRAAMSGYGSAS